MRSSTKGFETLGTGYQILLFATSLAHDVVEIVFLLVEDMSLVGNLLVGILDVGKAVVDRTLDFAYVLLAKFDFEGLVFYFLGQVVEFP